MQKGQSLQKYEKVQGEKINKKVMKLSKKYIYNEIERLV